MKIVMIIFLFMCFITTGCTKDASTKDELIITLEQIKASFGTYDILLSEPTGLHPENVFLRTLNGIASETFTINEGQLISIYVYSSQQEAKKGLKDFEDNTEAALVVPHSKYQIANVLFFYVPEGSSEDERVEEIMEGLLVPK